MWNDHEFFPLVVHNNFFLLKQLSKELLSALSGFTLVSAFSQNRDELLLEFNNGERSFFIRADLQPQLSCLSFPEKINRSKKNSIDLFDDATLKKVLGVRQLQNERSLALVLEGELTLLFKMHGSQSNVVLLKSEEVIGIFRNQFTADLRIRLADLDRPIDWSREHFMNHLANLPETYFTFGKTVWSYLAERGFGDASPDQKWQMFSEVLHQLEHPFYYLVESGQRVMLTLLSVGRLIEKEDNPITALNRFHSHFVASQAYYQEKQAATKILHEQLKSCERYLAHSREKLAELQRDNHYQTWGDLVMANLHVINPHADKVVLPDFYNNDQPVQIPLKKELSPQKNAEAFYRKHKNRKIEIQKIEEGIAVKAKKLNEINDRLRDLALASDLRQLRQQVERHGLKPRHRQEEESIPFHPFEHSGFKIWVGKNAESNDKLTLKYTFKEDLWLHAKDAAGSHVIIKYQAGRKFPKDVIERAAELAAFYSKRKNETLCPVAYTSRKFVRKPKGAPPGAVVVEKEDVILVEPKK